MLRKILVLSLFISSLGFGQSIYKNNSFVEVNVTELEAKHPDAESFEFFVGRLAYVPTCRSHKLLGTQTVKSEGDKIVVIVTTGGIIKDGNEHCPTSAIQEEFVTLLPYKIRFGLLGGKTLKIEFPQGFAVKYVVVKKSSPIDLPDVQKLD